MAEMLVKKDQPVLSDIKSAEMAYQKTQVIQRMDNSMRYLEIACGDKAKANKLLLAVTESERQAVKRLEGKMDPKERARILNDFSNNVSYIIDHYIERKTAANDLKAVAKKFTDAIDVSITVSIPEKGSKTIKPFGEIGKHPKLSEDAWANMVVGGSVGFVISSVVTAGAWQIGSSLMFVGAGALGMSASALAILAGLGYGLTEANHKIDEAKTQMKISEMLVKGELPRIEVNREQKK